MAEIHIIGQLESASGFPSPNLFCKWSLNYGGGWRLMEGTKDGQTQTDSPQTDNVAYFAHPIDVHLSTRSIQGWPKIRVEAFHFDSFGRQEIYGYGAVSVPTSPGDHYLTVSTWRPAGEFRDEVSRQFVGGGLQLRNPDAVFSAVDRYRLSTISMGQVNFRLGIIMRNFDKFGIEC